MGRKTSVASPGVSGGWIALSGWVDTYMQDKTTGPKMAGWKAWAAAKMLAGWTDDEIKNRIRQCWHQETLLRPRHEGPEELTKALAEVYEMVDKHGWKPTQAAVVYRSLANQYPNQQFLGEWAEKFEAMGERWQPL